MAFALKPRKSIKRQLKRIVRNELGSAADRMRLERRTDEDVHEARKSVKKVEAVARFLAQIGAEPPRKDLKQLRRARRQLSAVRDARVIVETFDRLRARFARRIPEHTAAMIRKRLTREKLESTRRAQAGAGSLARAGKRLKKIRKSAKRWPVSTVQVRDLPCMLRESFRDSRKAMKRAQLSGEAVHFHAWRKSLKNLLYQLRLAERLVSGLTKQIEEFRELETALGEEHNLVLLRSKLTRDRELHTIKSQLETAAALSTAFQDELRRGALVLGSRLHKSSPKAFAKDLRRRLRPKGTPRRPPAPGTRGKALA